MIKQNVFLVFLFSFLFYSFMVSGLYFEVPEHFPPVQYKFENNPFSPEKVTLGRALFYDPILSADNSISCSSCHSPYNAFAHTDHDLSHGIHDSIGIRNAPPLFNLAWQTSFNRDGAINHLDMQALAPITDKREMGEDFKRVIEKLQATNLYPELFASAFGDSIITGEHLLKALAQFQLTLVSADAKYDRVKKKKETFTEQETRGYNLFLKHCNSCHTEPLFTNGNFANNGLPVDSTLNDFGRGKITGQSKDSLLFKIPSLRNLSFTYPYMHDGRFRKLHQVLKHYSSGIQKSATLAPELRNDLVLSTNERIDLVGFLLTLDDKSFVFKSENQFPKEILLRREGF